jgi:hypothetical protein
MKVDKDTLVKQKFWVITGVSAFLTLLALVVLMLFVPRSIDKVRGDVETRQGNLTKVDNIKNQSYLDVAGVEAKEEKAKEGKVWRAADKEQRPLFFWPREFEKRFHFDDWEHGLFAYEVAVQNKDADLKAQPADQPEPKKEEKAPKEDKDARDEQAPKEENGPAEEKGAKQEKASAGDKGAKDDKSPKDDKAPPDKAPKGQQPTKDGKGAKTAEEPDESPTGLYHGRLKTFTTEYIVVVGRDGKSKTFYNTDKIKVTLPDAEAKFTGFADLKQYAAEGGDRETSPAEGSVVAVKYFRTRRFYDKMTPQEYQLYARAYASQLLEVLKEAEPENMDGVPLVQFPNWQWDGKDIPPPGSPFFHYVTKTASTAGGFGGALGGFGIPPGLGTPAGAGKGKRNLPLAGFDPQKQSGEEPWLAQEDLWIQRELFRLVKKTNDSVANFKQVGPKEFENPYWRLKQLEPDAKTKPSQVRIQLTNLLPRSQNVRVSFRVQFEQEGKLLPLEVIEDKDALLPHGSPLDSAKDNEPTDSVVRNLEVGGTAGKEVKGKAILAVRQMLTWDTAAIKRIDFVAIGSPEALAQRTSYRPLQPFKKKAEPAKGAEDPSAAEQGGKPGPGPDPKAKMPMPMPGQGGAKNPFDPKGGGTAANLTEYHRLVRDRYFEVTPQARRVPVSLVLIVDQAHAARVQTAFADSPMRFLTNQVILTRAKGVRPAAPAKEPTRFAKEGGTGGPFPLPPKIQPPDGTGPKGMPPGYMPGVMPPMMSRPGMMQPGMMQPGMMPPTMRPPEGFKNPIMGYPGMPGGPPGSGDTPLAGGDDQESNVELVLYGVVTLYERYPLRPPIEEAGGEQPAGGENPAPAPPGG